MVVRQRRIAIAVVMLMAGFLGAYWVATGQEGRTPWPPPPVKVDDPSMRGEPAALPTTPTTEIKPAVHIESKSAKDKGTVIRRACGVGGAPSPIQPAGFQDTAPSLPPPLPPPIPPVPTIPVPMEVHEQKATMVIPVIPMPDLPTSQEPTSPPPGGRSTPSPSGSSPAPLKVVTQDGAPAMPIADPPRLDPTKSVITDPVRQSLPSVGPLDRTPPAPRKPPSFILFKPGSADSLPSISSPLPLQPQANAQGPPSVQQTIAKSVAAADTGSGMLWVQTPPVTVDKRGLPGAREGELQGYQFIVRNLGTIAAPQVRVEDDLPADCKVLSADPSPQLQGNRAIWLLSDLPAGGIRVLKLLTDTRSAGESTHSTRVHVIAGTSIGSAPPPLLTDGGPPAQAPITLPLQIVAPATVAVGGPAVFEITYANPTRQRLTGMLLRAVLSDGLRHVAGQNIEADLDPLEPGTSKTVHVKATAVQPGRQSVLVTLALKNSASAAGSAQASVEVGIPRTGLSVQVAPATRLIMGRTADLRIEVGNNTAQPMRHVSIISYLPEGVEFVEASDYGNFQPNSRTVNWLLDPLPPGQTQALVVRVQPAATGSLTHGVIARADGMPEARVAGTLAVEAIADLAINLLGDNAVELGRETVYEVRVANPGSAPNTNVRVEVAFMPGLTPLKVQGPTPFRMDGQVVLFEGLSPLVSQGQAIYRVLAVGQAAGDLRVRASVISDQVRTPVSREVGTRVYRD
jgi:hypothetical protein